MSGDPAPRRKTRQGSAAIAANGAGSSGEARSSITGDPLDVVGALDTRAESKQDAPIIAGTQRASGSGVARTGDGELDNIITHALTAEGFDASEDGTGRGAPIVACATGEIAHTLTAFHGRGSVQEDGTGRGAPIVTGFLADGEVAQTLTGFRGGVREDGSGRGLPVVVEQTSWSIRSDVLREDRDGVSSHDQTGLKIAEEVAPTLDTNAPHAVFGPIAFAQNTRDEVRVVAGDGSISGAIAADAGSKQQTYVAFQCHGTSVGGMGTLKAGGDNVQSGLPFVAQLTGVRADPSVSTYEDVHPTLAANPMSDRIPFVAFSCKDHAQDAGDISPTLRAMENPNANANGGGQVAVTSPHAGPRRVSPLECERLQAFPDNYTQVTYRKKPAADGPRYRALGNSMCVNVMRWIGERIEKVERIKESLP
jgi:DNA (cytosine-5)-methyltransferase 1